MTGDDILTQKGWEYSDSERGESSEYSIISYAYDKIGWDDEYASAWFYFYTYNNRVERISYQSTEKAYKNIKASLSSCAYKQIDNEIHNGYITTTYSSPGYILEIITSTQKTYGGGTKVSYSIELIRKGGIYDDDNGEKVEYYDGTSVVHLRYTLKDGKPNGKYSVYYRTGTIEATGTMLNGKRNGLYTEYSENGWKSGEYNYKEGKLNGKSFEYFYDGTLESVMTYVNDELSGPYTIYYDNGKPEVTGSMLNGEKNGLVIEYNEDGKKTSEAYYKNGKLNGKCIEYFQDGTIERVMTYVNNELSGPYTIYYDNGKPEVTGSMLNGEKNGLVTEYDDDGHKTSEAYYKDGELNGKFTVYYSNGKISTTGTAVDDKMDGLFLQFDEKGRKTVECYYKNDEKNGKYTTYEYDEEKGDLLTKMTGYYTDNKKDGLFETLVKNEGIWQKVEYANYCMGVKNGDAKEWSGGDSVIYCTYINGVLDGKYQVKGNTGTALRLGASFYPWEDNLTLVEGTYSNGKKHGMWKFFNAFGWLQEEGNYKYGQKDGTWKYYSVYYDADSTLYIDSVLVKVGGLTKITPDCLDRIETYENGELNGEVIQYTTRSMHNEPDHVPDTIDYVAHYKDGLLHGNYEDHSNGNIISGFYYYGKMNGTWNYLNGKTGEKYLSLEYKDDKLDGEQKLFHNGKLLMKDVFDSGNLKKSQHYSESGKLELEFLFLYPDLRTGGFKGKETDNMMKTTTEYWYMVDSDSILVKPFCFSSSLPKEKDGVFIKFDSKNRKIVEGNYFSGKRVGKWTYFLPDQNVYYEEILDNADAPILFFNDDGSPYTGIVKFDDTSSNQIITKKIKNSMIQEVRHINRQTGKVDKKLKFKEGLPNK